MLHWRRHLHQAQQRCVAACMVSGHCPAVPGLPLHLLQLERMLQSLSLQVAPAATKLTPMHTKLASTYKQLHGESRQVRTVHKFPRTKVGAVTSQARQAAWTHADMRIQNFATRWAAGAIRAIM
jgi:hypothetical protein